MTLSRSGAGTLGAGIFLALSGLVAGSVALLASAAVLLLALAATSETPAPSGVRRRAAVDRVPRGAEVEIEIEVGLPEAAGEAEIEQPLPTWAEVVEGSNVASAPLDGTPAKLAMRVRFLACGLQVLPPVRVVTFDPLGLHAPRESSLGEESAVEILVVPAEGTLRSERATVRARAGAGSATSALGPAGEGVRALRTYAPGDPIRRVNWKATARALARGPGARPVVNEPERQGRHLSWIVVDPNRLLEAPAPTGRVLDLALEAAAAGILGRAAAGDEVGVAAGRVYVRPALGRRSAARTVRQLARVAAGDALRLPPVKARTRVVLITRLPFPRPDIEDAVERLAAHGAHVTVLDIETDGPLDEALRVRARARILDRGGRVATWRPPLPLEVP